MKILWVACALLLAQGAAAVTRIETETQRLDVASPRVERAVILVDGDRLRVDSDGDRTSVIYRGDRDLGWLLNHRERSYLQLDRGTAAVIADGRERANEALRDGIAGLPPQRRAAMERWLDATLGPVSAPPPVTVRVTGRRDSVAGIACEELAVFRGPQRFAQLCVADYAAAGLAPEMRDAVRELAAFLRESVAALAPKPYRQQGLAALAALDQLEGFPLRVRAALEGGTESETRVTGIAEVSPDPASFDLPAGYRNDLAPGGE